MSIDYLWDELAFVLIHVGGSVYCTDKLSTECEEMHFLPL